MSKKVKDEGIKTVHFKMNSSETVPYSEPELTNHMKYEANWHEAGLLKNLKSKTGILTNSNQYGQATITEETGTKLYKKRFWILFVYFLSASLNGYAWIQFSSISNIIQCFYEVDAYAINWTSNVFLVGYLVLCLPASWFIGRWGLKLTLVTASVFSSIGAVIQCFAIITKNFSLVLVGQATATLCTSLNLPIPPRLATVWFGPNEVCRATAAGVFGSQLGNALGFIIPSIFVSNNCSMPETIKYNLQTMSCSLAGVNIFNLILFVTAFQNKPYRPPSEVAKSEERTDYKKSLVNLMKSRNLHFLFLTYGLVIGVTIALSTLLNQILSPIFKNSEKEIGWIGLLQIMAGIAGAMTSGCILDATRKFKTLTLTVILLGLISTIAFTMLLVMEKVLWVQYITIALMGFFLNGFYPVGLEFASEITYPEPESTVAGIMNSATVLFGLISTTVGSYLQQSVGELAICVFLCLELVLAFIFCMIVRPDLKRTEKNKQGSNQEVQDEVHDIHKKHSLFN